MYSVGSDVRTSEVNLMHSSCNCHSGLENKAVNIFLNVVKNNDCFECPL